MRGHSIGFTWRTNRNYLRIVFKYSPNEIHCKLQEISFSDHKFQDDLNVDNVLGYGGKLAVCFAVLMRFLWSGKYSSYAPAKLKVSRSQT